MKALYSLPVRSTSEPAETWSSLGDVMQSVICGLQVESQVSVARVVRSRVSTDQTSANDDPFAAAHPSPWTGREQLVGTRGQ